MQTLIKEILKQHFPGEMPGRDAVRNYLIHICCEFISSGLADPKYLTELQSGELQKVWACISEALIANRLSRHTFGARKAIGEGPDFLIMHGSNKIWVEVVCPEPMRVPDDWKTTNFGKVVAVPNKEILLRWTTAIQAKAQKQIGFPDEQKKGYLASGQTSPSDAYVIAVNACRLRNGEFPGILGISQTPYAAEAVFPIGPFAIQIDQNSMKAVSSGHQHQPFVINHNGSPVPTSLFLSRDYSAISAIWALDLNGGLALGNHEPSAVIHNPMANVPIPIGFLPSDCDYVAMLDNETFSMHRVPPSE